jgi:hypothetical protein
MIELVVVGDVHATPTELEECSRLRDFLLHVLQERPEALVVFLGDQTDKNDSLSVRVMEFWRHLAGAVARQSSYQPIFLVGNHDQVSPGSKENAMSACRDLATVVDSSERIGPIQFVAYSAGAEQFADRCGELGGLLICHQDLAGASYDNGFKSKSSMVPHSSFVQVISGHLHVPQEFGRIWYPGSPRWRSAKDASVAERAIWWVKVSDEGKIVDKVPYDTGGVSRRVVVIREREGGELAANLSDKTIVEVSGSPEYVQRRRRELEGTGARFRGLPEAKAAPRVRESDGIAGSIRAHLATYKPPAGTPIGVLTSVIRDRAGVDL